MSAALIRLSPRRSGRLRTMGEALAFVDQILDDQYRANVTNVIADVEAGDLTDDLDDVIAWYENELVRARADAHERIRALLRTS